MIKARQEYYGLLHPTMAISGKLADGSDIFLGDTFSSFTSQKFSLVDRAAMANRSDAQAVGQTNSGVDYLCHPWHWYAGKTRPVSNPLSAVQKSIQRKDRIGHSPNTKTLVAT